MANWPFSDKALRAMYRGGKANVTARRFSRLWATVFGWGLQPKRWVTLEVPGRSSGRITRFQERAPIIKRYLAQVPGARPHIPVDRRSTLADFETIAGKYPVFLVTPASAQGQNGSARPDISGNHAVPDA